jgi:hypothetical protein
MRSRLCNPIFAWSCMNAQNTSAAKEKQDLNLILLTGLFVIYPVFYFSFISDGLASTAPRLALLCLVGLFGYIQSRKLNWKNNYFLLIVCLMLVLDLLTLLNPLEDEWVLSFIGRDIRIGGLLYQIASYGVIFLIFFCREKLLKNYEIIFLGFLSSGVINGLFMFSQYLSVPLVFLNFTFQTNTDIPSGLIGHPGIVAGFYGLIILIGVGLSLKNNSIWLILCLTLTLFCCTAM